MPNTVCLAYSGGLDTSAIVPWLRSNYDCKVVACVADVGQGEAELEGVEAKAKASGAAECHIIDLQRDFIEEFAFPTLISGALYEERYLLGTAIARPIIARAQVELARKTGATAVCHGCTGKGNDQVRFESAFAALAPDLRVIAPWREWTMRSRLDLLNYLEERSIPTTASVEKIYSRDRNLWHLSHEGGALEDPWNPAPDDVWQLTAAIADAPDRPAQISLSFEQGVPVAVDGERLRGEQMVHRLNDLGGKHGVGRIDIVENRRVGMKSRGLYETPGGTILHHALRSLEEIVLDRDTRRLRQSLGARFADLVYDGQWFTPERKAIWAALQSIAAPLTGEIVVRLHKGNVDAVQRRSPNSLYDERFATFDEETVYDQKHAEGFIRLFSLPQRIAAMRDNAPNEAAP
jgi:argininosuccinate synthase